MHGGETDGEFCRGVENRAGIGTGESCADVDFAGAGRRAGRGVSRVGRLRARLAAEGYLVVQVTILRPLLRPVVLLSLTSAMGVGVITCSAVLLLQRAGLEGTASNGVYLALGFVSLAAAGLSGMGQKRASRLTVLRLGSFGASVAYCILVGPMNG